MSSRSLNKVMLIGNLTRDPELRYTPKGTPVCNFGLATNRSWISNEEKHEEAEFHRIVAWSKLAELCDQLLSKGRKVYVSGRLQTRRWKDSEENERTTVEIVIDTMIVLGSKDGNKDSSDQDYEEVYELEEVPSKETPVAESKKPEKISEKDVKESQNVLDKEVTNIDTKDVKDVVESKKPEETLDKKDSTDQVNPDDIPF